MGYQTKSGTRENTRIHSELFLVSLPEMGAPDLNRKDEPSATNSGGDGSANYISHLRCGPFSFVTVCPDVEMPVQ